MSSVTVAPDWLENYVPPRKVDLEIDELFATQSYLLSGTDTNACWIYFLNLDESNLQRRYS